MKFHRPSSAFTLIELLVVIAIIGVLAAMVAPTLNGLRKGDAVAAGTSQLLGAVSRARQLAIANHTEVDMVFVPAGFWTDPAYTGNGLLTDMDRIAATNLAARQLTGYCFVSRRAVGAQPGQHIPKYLSAWQQLPETIFIPEWKFTLGTSQSNHIIDPATGEYYDVFGFHWKNSIPFPRENTQGSYATLPYITFDHQGRLISETTTDTDRNVIYHDGIIPLTHGSISTGKGGLNLPSAMEIPPGISTDGYNLIVIDRLTGRAHLETRKMQ